MSLIYIVEDDKNIREIECFALKNCGYAVEDFECAADFYKRLAKRLPKLVLLDVMLPDEDGLSVLEKLHSNTLYKRIPVIMVTAKSTEIDKVKGLDGGADDYITKPFGVMELISRVKAVLRRTGNENESEGLSEGVLKLDEKKHTVTVDDELCELTFKEYELLKLLMQNSGIVMRREVIMERVWGTDFEGESRTLDMHIKTLRHKLKSAGAMIKTVRNVGYVIEKDENSI